MTVYDYHAEPMQQKKVTDFAQGKGLSFLNEQDRRKLSKAISRATPEAPDVVLPVMVQRWEAAPAPDGAAYHLERCRGAPLRERAGAPHR